MNTSTLRSAAALLGAIILSVTLGGQPARAQTDSCPCLTDDLVDGWFPTPLPSANQPGQLIACVDDAGFTTFDYLDKSVPRSLLIDVANATSSKPARCVVDPSHVVNALTESLLELTTDQAETCREEILRSEVWESLGCPNN